MPQHPHSTPVRIPPRPSGARPPRGARPAPLRLEVTSDPAKLGEVRKAAEAFAVAAGLGEQAAADVGLSVNEAMANVIRHAYGGAAGRPIVVSAALDDCDALCMRVTIRDWGNGLNPAELPEQPHDPLTPGGLGLICLRRLMDEVFFNPQPDGMLLTLTKCKR